MRHTFNRIHEPDFIADQNKVIDIVCEYERNNRLHELSERTGYSQGTLRNITFCDAQISKKMCYKILEVL